MRIMRYPPCSLPYAQRVQDGGIVRYCSPSRKPNTTFWSDHWGTFQGPVPDYIHRWFLVGVKVSGYEH
jgi:hypothetical protein